MPSKSLWIFPNISILSHIWLLPWSEFIANLGQKTQKINCWRNLSPIATVITQPVGKKTPPLANQRTHVHTNHNFYTAYFPFLFRKLLLCSAAIRCLYHANELYELCCAVAEQHCFPSRWKNVCVTVNVICLYLPCSVILPQNTFGWMLQTVQKLREAFESLLKWHQVQTAHA